MKVQESPGGKYFKCLECDIVLCKVCYEQEVQLEEHSLAHDMRKMRISYTCIHCPVTLYKVINLSRDVHLLFLI